MTTNNPSHSARNLPSVEKVLGEPALAPLLGQVRRELVVEAVRHHLASVRAAVVRGAQAPTAGQVADAVAAAGVEAWRTWPTPVLNATGVVLHTNLGRAPLSGASIAAIGEAAAGYADLELDLASGKRGSRHSAVGALVAQLTGAEAAIAVNNNASAMLLGLAALAAGREVIVSRGEASEIGGGFRIPDVLAASGARLVEVGTVNRTYAADYERAITPQTAALLLVHRSNFKVVGFTHEPALAEVAAAGRAKGIPVLHDLGSGALVDTAVFGISHETTPAESLGAGADAVFFSGDKLLGGPQAGIVAGRADLLATIAAHPLARAVRADKLTLAALHATLMHYVRDEALAMVPVLRMLAVPLPELAARAGALARLIGPGAQAVDGESEVGGGSLPTDTLPTRLVVVDPAPAGGADELARRLRAGDQPIIGRIADGALVLDPRTLPSSRDGDVAKAVRAALGS
jgi:L-seryl-tRNA(Ser) seleniumtransferase